MLRQIKFNAPEDLVEILDKHVGGREKSAWLRQAIIEKLARETGVTLEDKTPPVGIRHDYLEKEDSLLDR